MARSVAQLPPPVADPTVKDAFSDLSAARDCRSRRKSLCTQRLIRRREAGGLL